MNKKHDFPISFLMGNILGLIMVWNTPREDRGMFIVLLPTIMVIVLFIFIRIMKKLSN